MQDIKQKTDAKEDPVVEQFCSTLANVALQVARRCKHEEFKNTLTPNPPMDGEIT